MFLSWCARKTEDLAQPTRIIEGCREGFGFAQLRQDASAIARGIERRAQRQPEIDGLLTRVARLRQMREGTERLLKVPHGLTVGPTR